MSATKAEIAHGAELRRGDGADPENFTAIPQMTSIPWPGLQRDTAESTNAGSAGAFREYVAGLKSVPAFTAEFNYLATDPTQIALRTDLDNGTLRNFRFYEPGLAKYYAFAALVTGWQPSDGVGPGDPAKLRVTFQVSGAWNYV